MKNFTKHLLLLCLFGMVSIGAKASYTKNEYDFKVNGIYYYIYPSSKTVSVTCQKSVHFGESVSDIPNGYVYHDVGVYDSYYDYTYYISDYSGNVTIPSTVYYNGTTYNVTRIEEYAFSNCFNVTSVTVPSSITYIAPYAFENCSGKLTLNCNVNEEKEYNSWSENYESVDPYILIRSKFTEIIIGEGVDHIGNLFCFYYELPDLKSITIPSTLFKIAGAFSKDHFSSLTKVNISNLANWFKMSFADKDDNPLYGGAGLYYNGTLLSSITIPSSITKINDYALYGCKSISSITIPNTIESIGKYAFANCSAIQSMELPTSVIELQDYAFQNCTSLTTINMPSSLVVFGKGVFDGCEKLQSPIYTASTFIKMPVSYSGSYTIPSGISSIATEAFKDCSKLVGVTIPSSVITINNSAFLGCSNLTSLSIQSGVQTIGTSAFSGCSSLTSLTIPSTVTSIGSQAFTDCSGKATINCKLPSSISSYSNSPFYNSKFTEIVLNGNDTSIPDYAFYGCSSLTKFTTPSMVTSIGNSAFTGCSSLTSLTIPSTVSSIGSYAFSGCSSLTSLTIPSTVSSIGGSAFSGCSGKATINCKLPSSISYYSNSPFYNSKFTEIVLNGNDTSIPDYAFYGCSSLTKFTIPSTVTSLGKYAFYGCSSLTSLTIPSTVSSIGGSAFSGCSGKATINCKLPSSISSSSNSPFYNSKFTEIVLNGNDSSIPDYAFYGCSSLSKFTTPSMVTSIGKYAFYGCSSLTSLTIPSTVSSIGEYAFYGCSSLTSLTIPSTMTSIGASTFSGCSSLTSLTIPSTVTNIGSQAFTDCSGKATINCKLPSSISSYSNSPFYYSKFTEIVLNGNDTSIPDYAFYGCSSLTKFTIPSTVTSLGKYAFYGCSDISSIDIPSSINWIRDNAFNGMMCLEKITVHNPTPVTITSSVFDGINLNRCTLFVPVGSRKNYIKAVGWTDITNIVEYNSDGVLCSTISLNKLIANLAIGGTETLTATVLPENASDKSVTWSSDNESVATVVDGVVTAIAVGTANITATTNDGSNLSAACAITVTSKTSGDEPSGDDPIDNPTYDNMLLTDDIMGFVGETCVLPVKMNNTAEISAVQFDLCLPEGITIAQDEDGFDLVELGERSTTQKHKTIETSVQPDGVIRVMCASSKNLTFDGNEGTILYITLNVADNLTDGEYVIKMKDVILSTASSTGYEQPLFASKIKVSSYEMGDLNKDHNINVIDYTAMCSMIMGTDGGRYPLELADFSGNGKVDVTDLTALVNKIMTSTASAAKPEMTFKAKTAVAPDANRLSLIPFAINPGETKELSLQMFNTDEISAYQTDLVLPEGIEVVKEDGFYLIDLSTKRTTARKHSTMESELQVDGSIRIMCASTNNNTFSGTEGEVAIITVKASETLKPGVYEIQLKNNVLSTAESSGFEPADCESSALVGSPEIASLSLNGDFTADAIAEYNTALASNTKVAAMDFCNATSVDAATKIVTGNKNLLVYVAEGMSIVNEDNAVIGDECANLVLTDGYAFCAPKEFTAAKASYTRAATNGLGTLCLPFAAKSVAGNLYELTSAESNKLTFTPVEEAKANTPYLYRSESAVIEETNAMVEADAECEIVKGDWTMTGAYSTNVFNSEDNVFALYDGKLYKNTGTLTVNPFRAYFTTTESASKAEILIDTPTGISNVNVNENDNENIYNINGVRVGKGYRGIVIKNGEKFIMK